MLPKAYFATAVSYKCKIFLNLTSDIIQCQFNKYFTQVTYRPSKLGYHLSASCMLPHTLFKYNFATAVSYKCKIFMKLTSDIVQCQFHKKFTQVTYCPSKIS